MSECVRSTYLFFNRVYERFICNVINNGLYTASARRYTDNRISEKHSTHILRKRNTENYDYFIDEIKAILADSTM